MDQILPYPTSQSRLVVAPQGLFPSFQQATFGAPGMGLAQGSFLNSYTVPLARGVAPPAQNFVPNNITHSFPPALEATMTHRNSLPTNYHMAPNIFPSPASASPLNPVQQYHSLYASYNACLPSAATVAPFNQTISFPPVPPLNYPDNIAGDDPSSTTVFVAGLPTCITEETLKTFFQNFGEIAYVKIPPQKGYGFVKFVRREDAKQAIIKMNDFPIHENSRIRLSWGRSLGDKKVEYVKKLSSALGISFESVWKIVQGQDPATIKQIAATVCGRSFAQPYEASKLTSVGGSDQHQQAAGFPHFGPVAQNHLNPLNPFPSVLPTHMTSSPIPLHSNTSFADASGVANRNHDLSYSNGSFALSEIKDGYHQLPVSGCQINSSSTPTSRPKALSQGSGSSSLPPPSRAMRNSWEELLPKEKSSQPVESPASSINEIRLPEVTIGRRATIPSLTPNSAYERVPLSQRHPMKSPGSAILSSSQVSSSMDTIEVFPSGILQVGKFPLVEEKEDFPLGRDRFLQGLLEEETRQEPKLEASGSTFHHAPRQQHFTGEPSLRHSFPWGPPSSDLECQKLSQSDHADWPRAFLGSKNIFKSSSQHLPHVDQNHEADRCKIESTSSCLNTWNFPSIDRDSNNTNMPKLSMPSISDTKVPISSTPDIGIKSLDNFWTLSL